MIQKPEKFGGLIDKLLEAQQQTTAVEKFSQQFTALQKPAMEGVYRDLIPLTALEDGQQYSFEVDMDACSGCKACVTACHNLNGLDDGEVWRNVGLLVGGDESPAIQHVTTACHHCVEPACMLGCPVNAYEKDAVTGIVEHLDDQCIGCKYCMFTCPYDVPSYSESKGIVRKCNMCKDRLEVGEAPACVQACPTQAIKIVAVDKALMKTAALAPSTNGSAEQLVPGAPSSHITFPTTRYVGASRFQAAEKLLPKDYSVVAALHSHWPLVFMLVLTQMAAGMIAATCFADFQSVGVESANLNQINQGFALLYASAFGVLNIGLFAAIFHLGRPQFAYRAMAGFRTSWLSREIIAFNVFAGSMSSLLAWCFLPLVGDLTGVGRHWFALSTAALGLVAVGTSAMVYIATKRPLWTMTRTGCLFYLSTAVTGTLATVAAALVLGKLTGTPLPETLPAAINLLLLTTLVCAGLKLVLQRSLISHQNDSTFTSEKHAALLLMGDMKWQSHLHVGLLIAGGIVAPLLILVLQLLMPIGATLLVSIAVAGTLLVLTGEFVERFLFFAVAVARRMPGAPNL